MEIIFYWSHLELSKSNFSLCSVSTLVNMLHAQTFKLANHISSVLLHKETKVKEVQKATGDTVINISGNVSLLSHLNDSLIQSSVFD